MDDHQSPFESGRVLPDTESELTFLVPFYDRLEHFRGYWEDGRWEGVNMQLVCDGSPPAFVDELEALVEGRPAVSVHAYSPNRGAARARAEGFRLISSTYVAACDDDDFIPDAADYARQAVGAFRGGSDVLLVTARYVVAFNKSGSAQVQYDRRWMHGKPGLELLDFIVRSGEIQALMPSVFRTADVRNLDVNDLFKRNQDLVLLVRLCAQQPDRRIHVLDDVRYMRLIHENSISSRREYTVEHLYNHALAMTVGAYHLAELGGITREAFANVLTRRGAVLERAVGRGRETFDVFSDLLRGREPRPASDEGRETLDLLERDALELPWEFTEFVPTTHAGTSSAVSGADPSPAYESVRDEAVARYEQGDVVTAIHRLAEAVSMEPDRTDAYIMLATLYGEQGDLEGALGFLNRAASCDARDPQVQTALGILKQEAGDVAGARRHLSGAVVEFERLIAAADALARTASSPQSRDVLSHRDVLRRAQKEAELRMRQLDGSLRPTNSSVRLRIALVCGPHQAFIRGIEERLRRRHDVQTIFFDGQSPASGRIAMTQIQDALDWADVAWFEWCDELLVEASRRLRKSAKIVCRLHSYEAFTDIPRRVDWTFVDHVVFVAAHIRDLVREHVSGLPASSVVLNGVDLEKLSYVDRVRGFNVAYMGYVNFKKNPELLLQVAAKLKEHDERYVVHLAGAFQELRYALYFEKMIRAMGLENHFRFHGWVDDIDAWLADKSYIISTSLLEGCPVGVIEAMAKGLKPVIHNWPGADGLYPSEYLFNTVDEAVARITAPSYDSRCYRALVEERYDLESQVEAIDVLLRSVLTAAGDPPPSVRDGGDEVSDPAPRIDEAQGSSGQAGDALISRDDLETLRREWGNSDWSASLDYLFEMARLASTVDGPILECGSGLSTIVLGLIAQCRGLEVWALEHDEGWYRKLAEILQKNGLHNVRLCHAPLKEGDGPLKDGGAYAWYDPPLEQMPQTFDLVVCDGPPGSTAGGRYGLFPVMASRFSDGCLVLLDDVARPSEQDVLRRWEDDYALSIKTYGAERPFALIHTSSLLTRSEHLQA